ncbi:hypothetical protein L218DRAFT_945559 [Marasmius fiardii PR-910]|nr:hypothetical protein L218DRAFT_945559 [Marasmius fiardii PR-910]
MAPVLNSIFIPDSSPEPSRPRPHSRTFSTATLESQSSHPTEPLLHRDASGSELHQPRYNRHRSNPDGRNSNWDMLDLSSDGDLTATEKQRYRGRNFQRRRLGIWKGVRIALEVVLGSWAIYNTVRYFIAYTIYSSMVSQIFALALGCTSAVASAFFICDGAVTTLQTRLIASQVPIHSLFLLRTVFLSLSSFFLFGTAIVNLVVTILWRRSQSELDPELRCNIDIDVIWSIPSSKATCPAGSSNWTAWIALAIFRVAFTLILVLALFVSHFQTTMTRRPTHRSHRKRRRWRRNKEQLRNGESSTDTTTAASASAATSTSQPTTSQSVAKPHPPSRSTSNPRQSNHNNCAAGSTSTVDCGNCPRGSDEDLCLDPDFLASLDSDGLQRLTDAIYLSPGASGGLTVSSLPDPLTIRDDRELTNFVNRFRMLVSQITRETEDALDYARSDTFVRPVDEDESEEESDEESQTARYGLGFGYSPGAVYHAHHVGGGGFDYPPFPPPTIGYDEFGRPYPPEDHVRILNSYVRRMPTIESLGSREFIGTPRSNSVYSGSFGAFGQSMQTLSRPPTVAMNNSEFGGGSEPSSRRGSLNLNMNALATTTTSAGPGGMTGGTGSGSQTPRTPGLEDGLLGRQLQDSPVEMELGIGRSGLSLPGRLAHSHSTFSFYTAQSGSGNGSGSSPTSEGFMSFSSDDSRPPLNH